MKIKAVVTSQGDKYTSARPGFNIEVKPCPCCGNENLSVGPQSSFHFGVCCDRYIIKKRKAVPNGCGLLLSVPIPEKRAGKKTLYQVEKDTIMEVVGAWNRRV